MGASHYESSLAQIWREFDVFIESKASWTSMTLVDQSPAFNVLVLVYTMLLFHLLVFFIERCPWQLILRLMLSKSRNCLVSIRRVERSCSFFLSLVLYWLRVVILRELTRRAHKFSQFLVNPPQKNCVLSHQH